MREKANLAPCFGILGRQTASDSEVNELIERRAPSKNASIVNWVHIVAHGTVSIDLARSSKSHRGINPDAHSTAEIALTHWGVGMARKGGVPKNRVLNCLHLSQLLAYLDK